ncbi:MAG: alpha/beta hydrolase [Devosia sp.]
MDNYQFAEIAAPKGAPLLFLFHGTGGDEHDLLDLGGQLMPNAHLIAPRGDVSEGGALRFFRRSSAGYDMADLARATQKMTAFIAERIAAVGPSSVVGLGYSNGANILASALFAGAGIYRSVLLHPMIPFTPPPQPALAGKSVLITIGQHDPYGTPAMTEALAAYFTANGAGANIVWHEGGHEIRQTELAAARQFLASP